MNNDDHTKLSHNAIMVLGAPGVGKGTLGKILSAIPRFFHCACGDVFRSLDTRTALGQQFIKYSSRGELVPDELTIQLWAAQIKNWTDSHQYKPDIDLLILDGIPRNVNQAEILAQTTPTQIHQVYHLSCPDRDELARRIRKRALKENRFDDASEDVIQHRIRTYEEETKPILRHYADQVTLVDATNPPAKVLHDLIGHLLTLPVYQRISTRSAP